MTRLPRGTFKTLTPEQQRAHMRELKRRYRITHREERNAYNKKFFDLWRKTKPFVVHCPYCGNDFNAPRRNVRMCPDCHKASHNHAQFVRDSIVERKLSRVLLETHVISLHKKGFLQQEIADKLGISQRSVSYLLIKNGIRTQKYGARKNKVI